MKGIVLASHGALAQGLYDALEMLTGGLEQVTTVGLVPGQDMAGFVASLRSAVDEVDSGEGAVVFCDLLSGTPCNCSAMLLKDTDLAERVEIVVGFNLPMVLEYSMSRDMGMTVDDVLVTGREGIADLKRLMAERRAGA